LKIEYGVSKIGIHKITMEMHSELDDVIEHLTELFKNKSYIKVESKARELTRLYPMEPQGWKILGASLSAQGQVSRALAPLRQAINLSPQDAAAHNNLGIALKSLSLMNEAKECFKAALRINPRYATAFNNLGNTNKALGSFSEAELCYSRAIELKPDFYEAHSNRLMLTASFAHDHNKYSKYKSQFNDIVQLKTQFEFRHEANKDLKTIRLGFVSGDLTSHPVGYFLEDFLYELRSYDVLLYGYSTHPNNTEIGSRISKLFYKFASISNLSDLESAELIHSDKIDVLFDLSGHTAKNRLAVFAYKPARIQLSWLGYFASTGIAQIDYILGDKFVTPNRDTGYYSEQIIQLEESYICFSEPKDPPEIENLPVLKNRFITFGCFNNLTRMNKNVIEVRAKILNQLPDSMLFLKCRQLNFKHERERVIQLFKSYGVGRERLIFEGYSPRQDYLESYNKVDIVLSPFPYGGGTTVCEGLWMGVPAIVKSGEYFLSSIGESIMNNSGLKEWVALTEEEYIEKAIRFALDENKLAVLRSEMRARLRECVLFNPGKFTSDFMSKIQSICA